MFRAETGGATIYQPGSYLFSRITELEDNFSHCRAARLTPLFHAQAGFEFPRSGRFFHSLLTSIMSAPPADVERRHYQWPDPIVTCELRFCIT